MRDIRNGQKQRITHLFSLISKRKQIQLEEKIDIKMIDHELRVIKNQNLNIVETTFRQRLEMLRARRR